MTLERLFSQHPRSIGETYLEHQRLAFGIRMVSADIACMVHALLPALFTSTGSRAIAQLHGEMILRRSGQGRVKVLAA